MFVSVVPRRALTDELLTKSSASCVLPFCRMCPSLMSWQEECGFAILGRMRTGVAETHGVSKEFSHYYSTVSDWNLLHFSRKRTKEKTENLGQDKMPFLLESLCHKPSVWLIRFFFPGFQVLEIYRFFLVVMPPHSWHSKYIRNVHRWCELIRNVWSPEVPDRIERHSHDGTWTH